MVAVYQWGNKDMIDILSKALADVLANKIQPLKTDYNPITDMPTYLNGKGYQNSQNYNSYNAPVQQNQSFMNNIASGLADFARGYQENRNNAFDPNNLTANQFVETIPANNTKLADYQQQLLNSGVDENTVNAVAQGKNSGNSKIAEWINGNPDAYPVTKTYDKGAMARLGEFLGSASRAANNPYVQAALAGTIGTALTGNPLYGASVAYNAGKSKDKSNIYQKALQDKGIDVNNGAFTNLGTTDFNALMKPVYEQQENDLKKIYYQNLADYHNRVAEDKEMKTAIDKAYKEGMLVINNKKADKVAKSNAKVNKTNTENRGAAKITDLKAVEELQKGVIV